MQRLIYRSAKFRVYPSKQQDAHLRHLLEVGCTVHNLCLYRLRKQLARDKCVLPLENSKRWSKKKHFQQYYQQLPTWFQTGVIRAADRQFFATLRDGVPHFRPKVPTRYHSIDISAGFPIIGGKRLYIGAFDGLRIKPHRPLPKDCQIYQQTLSLDGSGRWFYLVRYSTVIDIPENTGTAAVGVDVGCRTYVTLSTGEAFEHPHFGNSVRERMHALHRVLKHSSPDSARYRVADIELQRIVTRLKDRQKNFMHQLSRQLVDRFDVICVEDLDVKRMLQKTRTNSKLFDTILDSQWSTFISMLTYKAESAGKKVIRVPAYHTSNLCSGCGAMVEKTLSDRTHVCPHCGLILDRDHNAALNILKRGTRQDTAVSEVVPTTVHRNAISSAPDSTTTTEVTHRSK